MSHTAGPWICHLGRPDSDTDGCRCASILAVPYEGAIGTIFVDNGKRISEGGNDCPPEAEARANARLIVAAPDLLSACDIVENALREAKHPDNETQWTIGLRVDEVQFIRAAIAKAKGQP